jgi:cell division protein FtsI/penicillin-binding protein 2
MLGRIFHEEMVFGKSGTCSDIGTRYGWFASYANSTSGKIAVVVMLEGGYDVSGPRAAELAGKMYRQLYDGKFFSPPNTIQAEHHSASISEHSLRDVSQ